MVKVIISGYFDPLHVGHLEYYNNALELADSDEVIIIVNNDLQCSLKKSEVFMPFHERLIVISNLKGNPLVVPSIDYFGSVNDTLRFIRGWCPKSNLIFYNEGDVKKGCAEEKVCKELGIKCVYGKGKKIQSSRWLTKKD